MPALNLALPGKRNLSHAFSYWSGLAPGDPPSINDEGNCEEYNRPVSSSLSGILGLFFHIF